MLDDQGAKGQRPLIFGRLGADLVFFVLAFLGYCLILFARARSLGATVTLEGVIRQNIGWAVLGLLLFAAVVAWRVGYFVRARQLARTRTSAVIFDTGRAKALGDVIPSLSPAQLTSDPPWPLGLTAVADESGLTLWGGWRELCEYLNLRWEDVTSIQFTEVAELGRRSRGIVVRVRSEPGEVDVPLVVTGSGLAGLFPKSRKDINSLIVRIESLRQRAASAATP